MFFRGLGEGMIKECVDANAVNTECFKENDLAWRC